MIAKLTAIKKERQEILESTKYQRIADRQKKKEDRKQRYEKLVKHNEERLREKMKILKRKVEEYKKEKRKKN